MVKMSDLLDELVEIGCFLQEQTELGSDYTYYSLSDKQARKKIFQALKSDRDNVVFFQSIHLPHNINSHFYLVSSFDKRRRTTPILKVYPDHFTCHEIYSSKFKVKYMALLEYHSNRKKETKNA